MVENKYDNKFHDKIAEIAYNHFKSLSKTGKPLKNEWTVMSCIIKQNKESLEVIALATGTKCIGHTQMSAKGDILNDSHAEILCRRAFLRYLYHEIYSDSNLFKIDIDSNKFILDENVNFHFFTTHVPCGDAAIFPKNDDEDFGKIISFTNESSKLEHDTPPKKIKLDLDINRTGAKCLPHVNTTDLKEKGINYHVVGAVRTKPGRGDATLSVSCSDKIAKWGYLGIQGALLSILLHKPIYLSTFTIANNSLFNKETLHRALYDRFSSLNLTQNKMIINQATIDFEFSKTNGKQPCPSSIVYSKVNHKTLEVAVGGRKQGIIKKKMGTKEARLQICKMELFRQFSNTIKKYKMSAYLNIENLTYGNTKLLPTSFQNDWNLLKVQGFKMWTSKTSMLLNFKLD